MVRHLDQNAGTVSRLSLTAAGTPVMKIVENLDRLADDGVRFSAFLIHNETNSTRVVFECGVV
jgi:hypothetical protein